MDEKIDLLNQRKSLKDDFIDKKNALRAHLDLLKQKGDQAKSLAVLKEGNFKEIQETFREIDASFKEIGIVVDRSELLDGASRPGGAADPSKMNNSQLLGSALDTQKASTTQLKVLRARRSETLAISSMLRSSR